MTNTNISTDEPMNSASMQRLHQEVILEHSRERGEPLLDIAHGQAQLTNPLCGDEVTVQIHLGAGAVIDHVRWQGRGCAVSQGSVSLLANLAPGLTVAELRQRISLFHAALGSRGNIQLAQEQFGDAVALGMLASNIAKVKCATLSWTAAEQALAQLTSKN